MPLGGGVTIVVGSEWVGVKPTSDCVRGTNHCSRSWRHQRQIQHGPPVAAARQTHQAPLAWPPSALTNTTSGSICCCCHWVGIGSRCSVCCPWLCDRKKVLRLDSEVDGRGICGLASWGPSFWVYGQRGEPPTGDTPKQRVELAHNQLARRVPVGLALRCVIALYCPVLFLHGNAVRLPSLHHTARALEAARCTQPRPNQTHPHSNFARFA